MTSLLGMKNELSVVLQAISFQAAIDFSYFARNQQMPTLILRRYLANSGLYGGQIRTGKRKCGCNRLVKMAIIQLLPSVSCFFHDVSLINSLLA